MMKLWLFVLSAIAIQEFTTTTAALLTVRSQGLNLWIINLVWLAATLLEVSIGYAIGRWVQHRFSHTRLARWAERFHNELEKKIGHYGKNVFVFILGFLTFPWIVGFVMSWIDTPFFDVLVFSLLGEAVWYLVEWATALGVLSVAPNFQTALAVVVLTGVGLTCLFYVGKKKGYLIR